MRIKGHCDFSKNTNTRVNQGELTVNCHPLVGILAIGQCNGVSQVSGAERGRRMFHQVILVCALGDVLLRFECLTGPTRTVREEQAMQNAETVISGESKRTIGDDGHRGLTVKLVTNNEILRAIAGPAVWCDQGGVCKRYGTECANCCSNHRRRWMNE